MLVNRHAAKRFREFAGKSLSQVQIETGISLSYLSEIESGVKKNVSPQKVALLAEAYNVPVAALAACEVAA